MIWIAWRQHRAVLLSLAVYAAIWIAVVVYVRIRLASEFDVGVSAECLATGAINSCEFSVGYWNLRDELFDVNQAARMGTFGFAALAGAFVGAPMFAREWEQRTHLLVLSQSISVVRWFTTRVAVIFAATVLGAALLGLPQWWVMTSRTDPMDIWTRLQPDYFEAQPVTLVGYTLFAVALGITAGLLLRRTLPAMAVTLLGVVGAVYAVRLFARPDYLTPVVSTGSYDRTHGALLADPGRWRVDEGFVDLDGRFVEDENVAQKARGICGAQSGEPGSTAFQECMAGFGVANPADLVQPSSRFWPFQFIEFGLFALAAGVLIALSLWWLRKRSV